MAERDPSQLKRKPGLGPDRLQPALARLLTPLVRLMIRSGFTFPAAAELLREIFVNVAERDFALAGKEQTDSRVSLLTGIHRKEVRRLRGAGATVSDVPAAVSRGGAIIARWLGAAGFTDAKGKPLTLPRMPPPDGGPSFEALVESVTRDVRPRAILDDWLAQGLVEIDAADRIVLTETAFGPRSGEEALAHYFARNLHDHIAASVANVEGDGPRFLERAVHYDQLSEEQAAALEGLSRDLALAALTQANAAAIEAMSQPGPSPAEAAPRWRWIFGTYVYREQDGDSPARTLAGQKDAP